MEVVRQIINSSALKSVLSLPRSFQDIQVEVIVLPVDSGKTGQVDSSPLFGTDDSMEPVKHSSFGRLSAYANPSIIPEEEGAWEKAAAEKYALH